MKAYHKNAKHLGNKPPITRDSRPVFHELTLCTLHVIDHIFCVGVYTLYLFTAKTSAPLQPCGKGTLTLAQIP